jgi:hypothetical protein
MTEAPLAGLAFFGGWIVLLVASDVAALLKISSKRSSQIQNALLLGSIAAALALGATAYAGATHGRAGTSACVQRHAAVPQRREARHAASVSGRTSQSTPT